MCRKIVYIFFIMVTVPVCLLAQELKVRVTIDTRQLSTPADKKAFQTCQAALNNFLNNRKWTKETFQPNEKIVCNFLMNGLEAQGGNVYKAKLMVQAARPVYNTNYDCPIINFIDENVTFKYVEYQSIEFNDNRVSGSDPLVGNLTAILAYYAYMIIGLDFDSFSLRGGDPYFQKAMNIVNNAPEGRDISGWKAFDGLRNRYWLTENLTNNRYNLIHDTYYSYYRLGMDYMYENETEGRNAILNSLSLINTMNNDIPNTMIVQFFFQGKAQELIKIFKKATPEDRQKAREILQKIDISNSNTYKQELK
ncbi:MULTISPECIES: type IX secretion system protein PorD [Niastella]|uniref:DUF4835 family protein n=1 Tax=Niastella soli TaxID=2821487 RepID=A0ABS3YU80_9BACT|nr:DUF4835 family protein [Niastella soli]MBO9201443.1 DUF4835 family protein [Niastella soli]